ncbi:MAG: AAA family ATPase, partial [Nanoarchaeota archaeon]|nr:AAA family ATPase [Nanoarchaeota archaeon]
MEKIERVLEGIWSNEELRSTCIPLFMGNPGLGKTKIIEKFAKDKNVNLVEIIASQLMPHE